MIISLKNKVLLFFNSSSITYILLNNSNIAILAQCLQVKQDFYFDGLPSKVVCVYDMTSFTQMKW